MSVPGSSDSSSSCGWPTNADKYELMQIVGIGDVATVNQAYCIPRNQYCAIKRIGLTKAEEDDLRLSTKLMQHIEKITSVNHENLTSCYTSFIADKELWLVLKLLEGGSLNDLIKHKMKYYDCSQGVFQNEVIIASILKKVLLALEYLHEQGFSHGNIKSGNVLICADGTIQIGDFGTNALVFHAKESHTNVFLKKPDYKYIGSAWWIAPDVLKTGYTETKADIWSVGITAIEMVRGNPPYYEYPPMKVLMMTLLNDPPTMNTGFPDRNEWLNYKNCFHEFIRACLQKDPVDRPTATELLQHKFIKLAEDQKYLAEKLVPMCPTLDARMIQAHKLRTGGLGKLHRTFAGEWSWPEDEDEREAQKEFRPCLCADSDNLLMMTYSSCESMPHPIQIIVRRTSDYSSAYLFYSVSNKTQASRASVSWKSSQHKPIIIKFGLKIRNSWNNLLMITFEYTLGVDTPEGIGDALVNAGLLHPIDAPAVYHSLQKLLALRVEDDSVRSNIFGLNSASHNKRFDDKALIGFAELILL